MNVLQFYLNANKLEFLKNVMFAVIKKLGRLSYSNLVSPVHSRKMFS